MEANILRATPAWEEAANPVAGFDFWGHERTVCFELAPGGCLMFLNN
jgi:hypothetical protein